MGWVVFLIVGIIVASVLAWSHIYLHVRLYRENQQLRLEMKIKTFYGLFRYTFPTFNLSARAQSFLENMNKQSSTTNNDHQPRPKKRNKGQDKRRFRIASKIHKRRMLSTLKTILAHVKCTQFEWRTRIGNDDAATTAVIVGLLWAVKSSLVGIVCNFIQMKSSPRLAVIPLYNQNVFFTEGQCIVKIRFGYAMVAGILLLVRSVNVKGGIQSWMSTRFKVS